MMTIVIGADHAGFDLKNQLKTQLAKAGHDVVDIGPATYDADDDYPDAAERLGRAVLIGQGERGILICGSGVGASVAANKLPGIRAGLCHDAYSAHQGVEHDNINVLVLGSRVIGEALAWDLAIAFLGARFTGEERHLRRAMAAAERERSLGEKALREISKKERIILQISGAEPARFGQSSIQPG
jgi:RpiB/LacA/LacB family sugar-phosphate isomerase